MLPCASPLPSSGSAVPIWPTGPEVRYPELPHCILQPREGFIPPHGSAGGSLGRNRSFPLLWICRQVCTP